jgi:hypothetical protein
LFFFLLPLLLGLFLLLNGFLFLLFNFLHEFGVSLLAEFFLLLLYKFVLLCFNLFVLIRLVFDLFVKAVSRRQFTMMAGLSSEKYLL